MVLFYVVYTRPLAAIAATVAASVCSLVLYLYVYCTHDPDFTPRACQTSDLAKRR